MTKSLESIKLEQSEKAYKELIEKFSVFRGKLRQLISEYGIKSNPAVNNDEIIFALRHILKEKSEKDDTKTDKTAKKVVTTDDRGQSGFLTCGSCGVEVQEKDERCPSCNVRFNGLDISNPYPFGGSDF